MLIIYLSMLETDEERESFAEFYEKHQGKCLAVANAITKNHVWAEEAVHNAFLRMIRHKDKYFTDLRKRTRTQIVIMVRSEAINILNREKKLDHIPLDDVEPIIANDVPDNFRIAASKETMNRLEHHVSQLDEISQALFEMKYILDFSDGEIAERVGLSKNAVAIRVHRIRKKLIDDLRQEGFIDG